MINKIALALILTLASLAFAKEKQPKSIVSVQTDNITGRTNINLKDSYLSVGGCGWSKCTPTLMIGASATKDGAVLVSSLRLYVSANSWLFLNGVDVSLLVDGNRLTLRFKKVSADVDNYANCNELLLADIDSDTLHTLANAKSIQLEIGTSELAFSINQKWISQLKDFEDAVTAATPKPNRLPAQ